MTARRTYCVLAIARRLFSLLVEVTCAVVPPLACVVRLHAAATL